MSGGTGPEKTARRLAVFDLDGTLTRRDSFLPFAWGLLARLPSRWWRVVLLVAPLTAFFAGRIDRGALKGAVLHRLFEGLERARVEAWASRHARAVLSHGMHVDGMRALHAHQAAGDEVVLLSASPDLFVPEVGRALRVDQTICTGIRWNADHLDGRLTGQNRRGAEKTRVVRQLRADRPGRYAIAYGNSISDLEHMLECDEGVYVNADKRLQRDYPQPSLRWVRWR